MNAAGDEYLRGTRALLLRANLQKHNFVQTAGPPPRGPSAGGGGSSGGGGSVAPGGASRFTSLLA